jgi:tRNA A-37 threonylcarbamoyl transferase component Bud32
MAADLSALGYSTLHESNVTVIYRSSRAGLKELLRTRGPLGEASALRGRSMIHIIKPDLVVRTLMHGGLFRHLTGKNFISPARTFREIQISSFLISRGVRTPEILGARILEKGFFCNIDVVTRLVPDSSDLLAYLETGRDDAGQVLREAGKIVRHLHDSGTYHTDLHIKNLLLDSGKTLWILDLDKAYRFKHLPGCLRHLNIRRFFHSLEKWSSQGRIQLPLSWKHDFMQGYSISKSG